MKPTLLITLMLLLGACSDNRSNATTKEAASPSDVPVKQEPSSAEKEPLQTAPQSTEPAPSAKAETPQNGRLLFVQKCASCHGQHGEKAALNKSQIIAGWEKEKSINALKGYQNGTYGGNMKAIMKGQASSLSEAQIRAISEYIATL
ncbi:c-type cytochrome [Sulfurimonas sp. HSL3-7]|uniref:c-type cytochrome n=1 Tax=Sulfonitrofixus jiaomeiensis TaxID=3131938 RepID=UPI0031F7B2AC